MIIDCHAHVSAPTELWAYKAGLLSHRGAHGRGKVNVTDDEILEVTTKGALMNGHGPERYEAGGPGAYFSAHSIVLSSSLSESWATWRRLSRRPRRSRSSKIGIPRRSRSVARAYSGDSGDTLH